LDFEAVPTQAPPAGVAILDGSNVRGVCFQSGQMSNAPALRLFNFFRLPLALANKIRYNAIGNSPPRRQEKTLFDNTHLENTDWRLPAMGVYQKVKIAMWRDGLRTQINPGLDSIQPPIATALQPGTPGLIRG
jgi:hypothetical protein